MATKRVKRRGTSGPVGDVGTRQNKTKAGGYAAREALAKVLKDQHSPASAKVFAARTLAEMDGRLGRHQAPPSNLATVPLSQLSRDQLVEELGRLRALIDLGLVR
jgi:hypothetical protein